MFVLVRRRTPTLSIGHGCSLLFALVNPPKFFTSFFLSSFIRELGWVWSEASFLNRIAYQRRPPSLRLELCNGVFNYFKRHKMVACKFGYLKKIFLALSVVILFVTFKLLSSVAEDETMQRPEFDIPKRPQNGFLKFVHLDLKGGPPKLSFLFDFLQVVRKSGANAILIEYEDMFPFWGSLRNVSARNAYPLEGVRKLVGFAESLGMEVVPLVQTFGHLEYALKLEEFRGLRELENFPQEICPLKKGAVDLVKEMIKQIMTAHPNSKYVHIGCDEVRHVGACSKCSRINSKKLFANHVIKMADHVRLHCPGVTPLIWDDMLRRWTFRELADSGLGSAVEPVIWVYGNNIFTLVPPFVWNIYRRTFPRLWVASAFKGAFGETEILPDLGRHFENHLSWMRVISGEGEDLRGKLEIGGIFLTGWSRYDHFAVLCELLPVGVPSLVLGLTFLDPKFWGRHHDGLSEWLRILRCPPSYLSSDARGEGFFQHTLGNCSFPGSSLYSGMVQFHGLRARVLEVARKVEFGGWTSRYNLKRNFTSPWRLLEMFPDEGFAGEVLKKEILLWKASFLPLMGEYFDEHTVMEWEEQSVKPLEEKLEDIQNNFKNLLGRKTWPRRPLGEYSSEQMKDGPQNPSPDDVWSPESAEKKTMVKTL